MYTQVGATGAQGATGSSLWTLMDGFGPQGAGYTGIGVTGQDVLIYGNLLVTGAIDPTSLSLSPSVNPGPTGSIWYDTNNFVRLDQMAVVDRNTGTISSTIQNNQIQLNSTTTPASSVYLDVLAPGVGSIYVYGVDTVNGQGEINIKGQFPPYLDVAYTDTNGDTFKTTLFHNNMDYIDITSGADPFKFTYSGTTDIFQYKSTGLEVFSGKNLSCLNASPGGSDLVISGVNNSINSVATIQATTFMQITSGTSMTLTPGSAGVTIQSQLKLPTTSGSVSYSSNTLTINCGGFSTGIFVISIIGPGPVATVAINNAVTGGQYVVYIQCATTAFSINNTGLTPSGTPGYTNKTNFSSSIALTPGDQAVMTITTSATTNFISCTLYT
jgi:hypothetical protein